MHPEEAPVADAAPRLLRTFGRAPPTALVLGSGARRARREAGDGAPALRSVSRSPRGPSPAMQANSCADTTGKAELAVLWGGSTCTRAAARPKVIRYVRALHRWGCKRLSP